jgi:hypothetical protein
MTYPLSQKAHSMRPILWVAASIALLLFMSATCSYVAMAAVISLQPPAETSLLRIPVILSGEGDETLAGLQFDLSYDPAQYTLEALEAGGAATDAAKEAILSEPVPGTGRILITGFNDNELADGHVATVVLRPRVPSASAQGISITQPLATDPFGNTIPLAYSDEFGYPPHPPEKTDAQLNESLETEEEDLSSQPESNGDEPALSDRSLNTAPALESGESTISGFGSGQTSQDEAVATATPKRSGTSTFLSSTQENSPRGPGASPAARNRSSNGTSTSRPRTTGAQPIRNSATGNPYTERQSSQSPGQAHPTPDVRHGDSEIADTHLALVIPTPAASALKGSNEVRPVAQSEATVFAFENYQHRLGTIVLFCLFFIMFSVLHVRTFRWLSGAKRRRTA